MLSFAVCLSFIHNCKTLWFQRGTVFAFWATFILHNTNWRFEPYFAHYQDNHKYRSLRLTFTNCGLFFIYLEFFFSKHISFFFSQPPISFQGVIDYIFYSKTHMNVLGVLGPLDPQWLVENNITGCPHPHIPSDHFSLLTQLELHPPLLPLVNGVHLPNRR